MDTPAHPVVHRTVVDGVVTYWTEAPGPCSAALMFRVGHGDEPPSWGGVTHLVEHLALSKLDDPPYNYNGYVDQTRTVFHARGTADQVEDFLERVSASVRGLPVGSVADERRVLAAEGAQRIGTAIDELLAIRFGPSGYGRVGYEEFGLYWLDAADVEQWRDRYFTAGNAVLMMTGRPRKSLRLGLPRGGRAAAPPPRPVLPTRPLWTSRPISGVAVGLLMEEHAARGPTTVVLERRLRRALRFERSISYDVSVATQDLGGVMHAVVWADAAEGCEQEVIDTTLATIAGLLHEGATGDELTDTVNRGVAALAEPDYIVAHLDWVVCEELHGRPVRTSEERMERILGVTGEDVGRVISDAMSSALMLIPPSCVVESADFAPLECRSPPVQGGRVIAPSSEGLAAGVDPEERLLLTPETLSLQVGTHATFSVHLPTCALVLRSTDGTRVVTSQQGMTIPVYDWQWLGGDAVLAHIDDHTPAASLVDVRDRALSPPRPEDHTLDEHKTPARDTMRPPRWPRVVYVTASVMLGLLAVGFVLLTVDPELDDEGGSRTVNAVGALICVGAWLLLARWYRRRQHSDQKPVCQRKSLRRRP